MATANKTRRAHCAHGSEAARTVIIVVPGIPPSVNHYVKHTRFGRHYVASSAARFKGDIAVMARGQRVEASRYIVTIDVHLGRNGRGDIDNFAKVVLDGLKDAGVIHSDAAVDLLIMQKHRDRTDPHTTITIEDVGA